MKKLYISIVACLLALTTSLFLINASSPKASRSSLEIEQTKQIDTTTNFYSQKEDTRTVETGNKESSLLLKGYKKIATSGNLTLYRYNKTMAIAVYDKSSDYTWFSSYENLSDLNLGSGVNAKIESGVTIEYYNANTSIVSYKEISFTTKNSKATVEYSDIENGFVGHFNFPNQGIKFDVEVSIGNGSLYVNVPVDSISEETVGTLNPMNYQLKSVSVFPYFGSQNYQINGYSFIPDGSGALVRYVDEVSATAYMKRVYGNDYGFSQVSTLNSHIKDSGNLSLPIYGVNHGYNQAAFLCEITSGDGAAELHSYPYMYGNLPLNTTYFKMITRDNYLINFSDNSQLNLVNDVCYPNDYSLKYSFLSGENANYVGMANKYRESLGLTANNNSGDIALQLNVLGVDYKQGLFGKNYVEMTKYEEALNIVKDLKHSDVNVLLTYLGWNKGGYFNDGANNGKIHRSLGNKKALKELISYMDEYNMEIDFTIAPTISDSYGFKNSSVKKINLVAYDKKLNSSLEQTGYYINSAELSKNILKNDKRYSKLGITGLNIDYLTDSYSYRYKSDVVYRTQMIQNICNELAKVDGYSISTTSPNAYLYKYLNNYYSASYESSKYLYETDSIPFISLLLSGYVNLYSPNINYISDYDLMNLRMVEYNIAPSFIVTEDEAYNLRFTNYEYLNSTQYDLWESLIKSTYSTVNGALSKVNGAHIINHRYIDAGVAEITYSNNKTIYVNYNNHAYTNGSVSIAANNYLVKEGM